MSRRKKPIEKRGRRLIYHIYNRGNRKEEICLDINDYRFLYNLLCFHFKNNMFDILCLCIMPNHYHIVVKNNGPNNRGDVMRKIASRYTKYYNSKYDQAGHLFQGQYKHKIVANSRNLKLLTQYIENHFGESKSLKREPCFFTNEFLVDYFQINFWDKNQ
jgi:REP element-mobilizing transposase RayT